MASGLRNVSFFPMLDDITRHRLLIPLFKRFLLHVADLGVIDPYSFRVICYVDSLLLIPCTLLSLFRLRWVELENLCLASLIEKREIQILQDKVNTVKVMPNDYFVDFFSSFKVDESTPLKVVTYNATASAIRKALLALQFVMRDGCMCATHFFRHAYATWAFAHSTDLSEIRKQLGHSSDDAVDSYINSIVSPVNL